jgi:anthraniloyl-CoA monooxygenase
MAKGAWPIVAPSRLPYTRRAQRPRELPADELPGLIDDFASAAWRAGAAGFDALVLDMAHGYLLASFLSPLTNRRTDRFGGSLENRSRFPLDVFETVRDAWPSGRALAVALLATDWVRAGFGPDDAVQVARWLKDRGCDLILPVAGQTVSHDDPAYGRFFLVPFADRIRNEVDIATLVGGNITTNDEMNTILAAGRADLCLLDPRP